MEGQTCSKTNGWALRREIDFILGQRMDGLSILNVKSWKDNLTM